MLHTGVASLEADELPYPERVHVPESTAERVMPPTAAVNGLSRSGRPGQAPGDTALDHCHGVQTVGVYDGWTDLVISPEREVRIVDGMITGWHEPASSHLMMLDAIAGRISSPTRTGPHWRRGSAGTSSVTST